ncbi:MAG: leucyl/phenylalanyl-tRNA--protein transferase [Hyphomicrobium sp.]
MGTAFALHPRRIADVPFLLWDMACDIYRGGTKLPSAATERARPDTFAGVCRDLTPERVIAAARRGYFPWCHVGPLKWWTRQNRMVLFLGEQHMAKRLRRDMRKSDYLITFDTAFDEVIKACAEPRKGRPFGLTWVTPKIMRLYAALHDVGFAHSFEVWSADGRLIGGGYGFAIGRVFFTESQFSRESNTSKMGFASLNHHLAQMGLCAQRRQGLHADHRRHGLPLNPARRVRDDSGTERPHRRQVGCVGCRGRSRNHSRLSRAHPPWPQIVTMPAAVRTRAV